MKVERIALNKILQIENSRDHAEKNIVPLMNSIQQHGLQEPIGVNFKNGNYTIVYGNRRYLACQKLGWSTIPAVIYTDMTEEGFLVNNLVENMQRENVSPSEIGRICEKLEKLGLTQAQMASRLGTPITTIKTVMELYKTLPENIREKVFFTKSPGHKKNGKISISGAKRMLSMRQDYGLTKPEFMKLFEHSKTYNLSNEEINIVGLLMRQGISFKEALVQRKKYKVYRIDFIAIFDEMEQLAIKEKITPQDYLAKVIYGEFDPITKPSFVNLSVKKGNRHASKYLK